jgi:hypothetical protein
MWDRDYAAARGSFTSRDPIYPFWMPQAYAYVVNRPTFFVDPLGLKLYVMYNPAGSSVSGHVSFLVDVWDRDGRHQGLYRFGFVPRGSNWTTPGVIVPGDWQFPGPNRQRFARPGDPLYGDFTKLSQGWKLLPVPTSKDQDTQIYEDAMKQWGSDAPDYEWTPGFVRALVRSTFGPPWALLVPHTDNCATAFIPVLRNADVMTWLDAMGIKTPGQMAGWAEKKAKSSPEPQE